MPTRKAIANKTITNAKPAKKTLSISIPTKFSQQQILYTLLLVAVFLVGYLVATVQSLKKPAAAPTTGTAAAPQAAGQAQDPNKKYDVNLGHLPAQGKENAKVTLIEFSDFECPFCGKFYSETLPQITKEYIDTGKVKLYYRHYPLSFHPKATPLALASECANDQGAFWKIHDKIFDNTSTISTITDDQIKQWGVDLGLDTNSFNKCYDNKTHQSKIDEDFAAGGAVGVSGTPTFFINGKQLIGAQPFDSFKAIIDQELSK